MQNKMFCSVGQNFRPVPTRHKNNKKRTGQETCPAKSLFWENANEKVEDSNSN